MTLGAPAGRIPLPPTIHGEPSLEYVLFDAGHTLIHDATPPAEIARAALEAAGIAVPAAEVTAAMEGAMDRVAQKWHRGDWWLAESSVRELFTSAYAQQLRDVPALAGDDEMVRTISSRIYETYQDPVHWRTFPDVLPALRALRAAGVRMGVISDWGHGLEAILLELELGAFLEFLVVSARVGIGKPDPRVFELALARSHARPETCVYVGDTYVKDVMGARAAGISAVLLDRAGSMPPLDCPTVRDLHELLHLVGVPVAVEKAPSARPRTRA